MIFLMSLSLYILFMFCGHKFIEMLWGYFSSSSVLWIFISPLGIRFVCFLFYNAGFLQVSGDLLPSCVGLKQEVGQFPETSEYLSTAWLAGFIFLQMDEQFSTRSGLPKCQNKKGITLETNTHPCSSSTLWLVNLISLEKNLSFLQEGIYQGANKLVWKRRQERS